MSDTSLQNLAQHVISKRAGRGIRETAKDIGISPATLSRVEKGGVTDLETFRKICEWLAIDPGRILGYKPSAAEQPEIRVHFKKEKELEPETARALAEMIMKAHQAMLDDEKI